MPHAPRTYAPPIIKPSAGRRRYVPLCRRLAAVPASEHSLRLSFDEIAALTGGALPASAELSFYWRGSSVARMNWELDGWLTQLDRPDQAVTFTRRALPHVSTTV